MRNSKKILVSVLAAAMFFPALASCGKKKQPQEPQVDLNEYAGPSDEKHYTYRLGPSDIPTSWNIHTYQSNSSTYVLDYTTDSLYTFDYNDTGDGYKIVPGMAKAFPVDVTSEYVGRFGVKSGDENKVWAIELKDNLKFDNGDAINAESFVKSMKLLLNPEAANFRADNMYQSGQIKIQGAEEYAKGGTYATGEFVSENYGDEEYVSHEDFTWTSAEATGTLQITKDETTFDVIIDIASGGNWGSNGLMAYADNGNFGSNPRTISEINGRVKYASNDGTKVVWRSSATVGEGEEKHYEWFTTEEGTTQVTVDESKADGYYLVEGETSTLIAWKNCIDPESISGKLRAWAAADTREGLSATQFRLTREQLKLVQDCISMLHSFSTVEEYAAAAGDYAYIEFEEMAFLGKDWASVAYENTVGFLADSQGRLVVVLKNPMEDNFYLRYGLCTDFFLVHAPTYEACIRNSQGVYENDYGTSVSTYVGFGPYKLVTYTADSEIKLERNKLWRGYTRAEYKENTYKFNAVQYKKVDDATRLQMFKKGELDSYGLLPTDMDEFLGSKYTYFNDSESTWYLAMNPQVENLQNVQASATCKIEGKESWTVIKTPLANQSFRQALSYSLDRTAFNAALSPTSGVAKALLSSMIIADPDSGLAYRATEQAKDAILEFWGLADKVGSGKEFATKDDAIASITGFDPDGAKALFTTAYNECKEAGYITEAMQNDGHWVVQIVIGNPVTATFYTEGFQFLSSNWVEAVEGTPFEGHLEFVFSQELGSTTFGNYLRNGSVDILFGVGYGGSMFDPYSMMDCFTGSLQYDPFTTKTNISVDIFLEEYGKTLRASLYDWVSVALQGDEITAYVVDAQGEVTDETVKLKAGAEADPQTRLTILAKCETKIMTLSNIFPIQTDASASLRCMRVKYKTEEYILGLGRGGLKYFDVTMSDEDFVAYAEGQPGGILDYTVSD